VEIHIKIENLFLISPPLGRRGLKLKLSVCCVIEDFSGLCGNKKRLNLYRVVVVTGAGVVVVSSSAGPLSGIFSPVSAIGLEISRTTRDSD